MSELSILGRDSSRALPEYKSESFKLYKLFGYWAEWDKVKKIKKAERK